jgi:hypothetical protein
MAASASSSAAAAAAPALEVIEVQDFDGAAASAMEEPKLHLCMACNKEFGRFSELAYVVPAKGHQFAHPMHSTVSRAIEKADGRPVQNKCEDEVVILACWRCCEEWHQVSYKHSDGRLTSSWSNKSRGSKRCSLPPAKLTRMLKAIDEKRVRVHKDEHMPSAEDAYKMLKESTMARAATDFITVMVDGCLSLHYGCGACMCFPLQANGWWRCSHFFEEGITHSSKGHWRCANCLDRWTAGKYEDISMFVLGDSSDHMFIMTGGLSADQKAEVNIIKGSMLLKVLNGKPVTKQSLLDAIGCLHNKAHRRLASFAEVIEFAAKDPSSTGAAMVCEDVRLSLSRVGEKVLALKPDKSSVLVATSDDLDDILATAGAFMSVESFVASSKKEKAAYWRFSERVARKRVQLM